MACKQSAIILVVAVYSLFQVACSASCENNVVGLADGYILDSQLSASSELNANSPAKNGRLNYTAGSSWCASTGDSNPYLQIDLETLHVICAVSTQGNSQGDQWVETYTLQSSEDGTTWTDYKEHGQSNKRSFNGNYDKKSTVKHILYSGIVARYLRFVSKDEHGKVCLRVEVFGVPRNKGNIAFLKPTSQSGTLTYNSHYFKSSHAVDGGKQTIYIVCSHTDDSTNKNPWWRVDLGRVEPVAEVYILNNGDLNGAEIRVGNSTTIGGADSYLCATAVAVPAGTSKTFFCKPIAYGRYVSISLSGVINKYLKLCEVEVYSSYISNLALNQPTSQVSTDYGGAASRAVDGNPNNQWRGGSCTHTDLATDPWWRVDLGSSFPVAKVVIVNRQCTGGCADVLKAFEIRIGNNNQNGGQSNPSCGGTHSMVTGETKSFYCTPRLLGRFVYVLVRAPPNNKKVLTICELEVYSTKQSMNDVKGCASDPVGVSNSFNIRDQRFSASSFRSGKEPSNGRLKGASAWIPATNSDISDYLQIDLGSVYFVCGVAVQGNPAADDWAKTYKIKTSLDNVNWTFYSEGGAVKSFTGNNDRSSIIRSELYEPLAAKFIRFYPVLYHNNKALRVEVYGSMQGCLSTVGNERDVTRDLGIRASSNLDSTHTPSYSRLHGITSWCSKLSGPLPHYLEFDLRSIITVTGVATQGDAVNDKWVPSYTISYGYDRQIWIRYAAGQQLTANSDKSTVVVNWLSKPFAAQYVKIFPTSYNSGICMRMDLFVCKDFQVPYIFVNKLKDVQLTANPGASVTLKCTARFSPQRPPAYEWSKGATVLPGSDSSLTITYKSATDTHTNYNCGRKDPSTREVNCSSTYQCTASLPGMEDTSGTKANVIVFLKVPGPPAVQVDPGNIKARSTSVTWSYSPGSDELSIDEYTLQYQNRSFTGDITLSGSSTSKDLINLKPYTSYSVRMMAKSALGEGLWSGLVNFKTKTAAPSIAPPNINSKKVNETTYIISWNPLPREMSNGEVIAYEVNQTMVSRSCAARANSSAAIVLVNTTNTFKVLFGLKACSQYNVIVRAYTTAGPGVFGSIPRRIVTTVPSAPTSLSALSPQSTSLTLNWTKPSLNSELVETYQILFNGTKSYFKGFKDSRVIDTSGPVLTYKVDTLLPGTEYTFAVRAKSSCGIGDVGNGVVVETMVDYPRSPNVSVVEKISTPNTSLSVTVWGVEPYNGPISHYQVIVQRVNNWADEIPEKNLNKLLDYDESQEQKQGFYIAAELQSELIHPSLTFDIGDGKRYGTYKNVALAKSQKYKIYIRAVTTSPKYLPGRETLTAMVIIMKDEQGTKAGSYTGDKPSNTVLVILNIILGVVSALSLGVNVYLWRVRRTPKTGEKYSPEEIQVDAPENEQGDADIQAPQQTSDYMELRPTQIQVTASTSEYRSLTINPKEDAESKQEYVNVDFRQFPEANENEEYETIDT